uniref:Uncharacterized protein n=1 Tax=Aegilops tauschii subsp. strangulata TaxID=200361 RepID=A0A453HPT0_AEGTS
MEAAAAAASSSILLSFSSPRRSTAATFLRLSTASPRITCSATQQLPLAAPWLLTAEKSSTRRRRSILSLRCSSAAAGSPSAVASSERWILEPAGDGDWKHIGYRVARPGAIEIASVRILFISGSDDRGTSSGERRRRHPRRDSFWGARSVGEEGREPGGHRHGQHQRHLRQREEAGAGIPGCRPTREPPHLW